jgi:hypothetical protein
MVVVPGVPDVVTVAGMPVAGMPVAGMPVARVPVARVPVSAAAPMPEAEEGHGGQPGHSERKTKPVGAHMLG